MATTAFIEWLETFRSWDSDKLNDHIESLEGQITIFSSQGVGSKNFTRDLGELRTQLSAATRAKAEKGQVNVPSSGVVDYSCVNAEGDIRRSVPDVPTSL